MGCKSAFTGVMGCGEDTSSDPESDIGVQGVCWGNINSDPLFCYGDSDDFTLYNYSPCIGTGEGGVNMGASEVGCYYEVPIWHVSNDGSNENAGLN